MFAWEFHPVHDLADAPEARNGAVLSSIDDAPPDLPCEQNRFVRAFRTATAVGIRAALRIWCRFEIVGRENLPADGTSFVMVANHASHLDGVCLLATLPLRRLHRAYPVAAKDYFFRSPSAGALAAMVINALPFDRAGNVRRSMARCRALLARAGNVLIVFPEGTRSTSGAIGPFRRGVGDLIAGTHVPVVPCYLDGAGAAWPKGAIVPRPRRVRLVIGTARTYYDFEPCKQSARAIGEDLRRAVLALAPSSTTTTHAEGGSHDGRRSPAATAAIAAEREPAGRAA